MWGLLGMMRTDRREKKGGGGITRRKRGEFAFKRDSCHNDGELSPCWQQGTLSRNHH